MGNGLVSSLGACKFPCDDRHQNWVKAWKKFHLIINISLGIFNYINKEKSILDTNTQNSISYFHTCMCLPKLIENLRGKYFKEHLKMKLQNKLPLIYLLTTWNNYMLFMYFCLTMDKIVYNHFDLKFID